MLAEYTNHNSIDRVLVSTNSSTYVDIDSLNDEDKARRLKVLISEIEQGEIEQSVEAKQHLFDDLKSEDIKNLLDNDNMVYMERPLLLFLLSQPLSLKLLSNIDTYTLTNLEGAALYSGWNKRISSSRQNFIVSSTHMIHEITHSLFNEFMSINSEKMIGPYEYFSNAHPEFYKNISKNVSYKNTIRLESITNELIAYLMQSLTSGHIRVRTFDKNGNSESLYSKNEAIYYKDIEILVELGFLPHWAAPSVLYEEGSLNNDHPIDRDYYVQLFEYYTENCEDLF